MFVQNPYYLIVLNFLLYFVDVEVHLHTPGSLQAIVNSPLRVFILDPCLISHCGIPAVCESSLLLCNLPEFSRHICLCVVGAICAVLLKKYYKEQLCVNLAFLVIILHSQ